jgi:hypothetical protein
VRWVSRSRRKERACQSALAAITLAVAAAAWAGVARADQVDACIAAAEQSQVLRRDGHLLAAHEKLLVCARDACPHAIQKDCKRWLGEVEVALPTVVIRAADAAGGDVASGRVTVDGVPHEGALTGRAFNVDPGEHALRVEAGDRVSEQKIIVRKGERDRLITLQFPTSTAPGRGPIPSGAWVLGGVGLAGITTGAVLWGLGRGEHATLYSTCGVTHSCEVAAVDHARAKLVIGDVVFGVGLAAVAAAVWWGVTGSSAPKVPVSAAPVAGGGVLSWQGSF